MKASTPKLNLGSVFFGGGGRENINIESVYSAFSSDIFKSRKFPGTVRNRTVVDANGMFL